MKKGLLLLSAILALGSLSSSAQRRTATMTDEEMYLDAMHRNITTEKIFGYVKQLSDPALEGRLAGSPGMAKAVDIVKGYFKEWGYGTLPELFGPPPAFSEERPPADHLRCRRGCLGH